MISQSTYPPLLPTERPWPIQGTWRYIEQLPERSGPGVVLPSPELAVENLFILLLGV